MEATIVTTNSRTRRIPDDEYYRWKKDFAEKLRNTPEDKLSKAARYWLEQEGKEGEWVTADLETTFG